MAITMKSFLRLPIAVLAGLLFWGGFAPIEVGFLPIIGGALLFYLLAEKPFSERILTSCLVGIAFFLPLLHWSSTYVGATPWLILATGEALLFALISLIPLQRNITGAISFAGVFLVVELFRMKFPFGGFGWGRIGFTQIDALNYLYPWLGVAGITFFSLLVSALLVLKKARYFIGIFLVFTVNQIIPNSYAGVEGFNISAVQGGVTNLGLDFNSRALEVLQRHIDASKIPKDTDLILWPENSVDVDPTVNKVAQEKLMRFIRENSANLLTGTVEKSNLGPKNSSVLYNPDGSIASRYVKQDLAPFGEYIPLRFLAEKISGYAQAVNDFVPGDRWNPIKLADRSFQSFICFEVLDDDHVRAGARDMDFLIAQTNNATFGASSQAAQQLQITRARSAELKKEIAVVSTTGFTVHLDQNGDQIAALKQFEPGTLDMKMSSNPNNTLASSLGSGFWAALGGLFMLAGLLGNRR
ncbi:MAG: apolipoprotein N-acyltransferase [Candidatus Nanopelagicaceae bacterium]|nr:apolipoprotein N-acyltransferase [Candidatus Nanopelagicaceae bacterium]